MALGKRSKLLVVLLALLVVTAANATPTVSKCNSNFVVFALSPSSDVHIPVLADVTHTIESGNSHLAGVAVEFLKPPAAFTDSPDPPVGVKSLPVVPGALFMALTGLFCVLLVKVRGILLWALTGLLWVGLTGIQAVPQLALRLSHRNHTEQQLDAELTYPYYLENSALRCDIEGMQYVCLPHHLAGIPHGSISFLRKQECSQTEDELRAPQFAIKVLMLHLIPATNCLAGKGEQSVYLSSPFVFAAIPRGPPVSA